MRSTCLEHDSTDYVKQQPDLNWEDPEVRQAIYKEAVLFWLERGLDGFRVDGES